MDEVNGSAPRLVAVPLKPVDFDSLVAALHGAQLPADDLEEPGRWFWRFETPDELPAGFGGIEVHGENGLLRSIVTLPPLRGRGIGSAMIQGLEFEARLLGCSIVWALTTSAVHLF